jgi:methionyl-tRNA formyltransferase
MRILFLGSGAFAIPSFEALVEAGHELAALVTQPDRAKGRGRRVAPPPLKPAAEARGVRVLQPTRVREPEAQATLRSLRAELGVVVAYGQILPRAVLELAPLGMVNVHASLLPRYRGAAPIQWAIARGETVTGVTTMRLDEGLDTGPILLQRELAIGSEETARELSVRLARVGAALLIETLARLARGDLVPTPQDPALATLAPLLRKQDGQLDWALPAPEIARRVRGFDPWPGVTATLEGRAVKLLRARAAEAAPEAEAEPGTVLAADASGMIVACGGATALRILEVQPESRHPMPASAFAAGARLRPGARFA